MDLQQYENKKNNGYITTMLVLVLGVVGVGIAISLIVRGVDISHTSFVKSQSLLASGYAESCVEDALQRIRNTTSFVGTSTQMFVDGNCVYSVVSLGGSSRLISATGTVGDVVQSRIVNISAINPKIIISVWGTQ